MFIRSPQVCVVYAGRRGEGWGVKNKKKSLFVFGVLSILLSLFWH